MFVVESSRDEIPLLSAKTLNSCQLVQATLVRLKPHNIQAHPLVERLKQPLQRDNLVPEKHIQRLTGIAKATRVVGDAPQQPRRHAMRGQHIVFASVLDRAEIVLGCDLADRDQL